MKLSLCLAVFNEEKNIHIPLDSTYDFVDEVIIIDGGSTDKTVEIAKSYGDKVQVFFEPNPPMFHINKQKAIEKASGEWIIQLDADEALTNELKEEINEIVGVGSSGQNKDFVYYIPRKNFFLTRFLMKGGQYPDYTIRFYKKGAVKFPCKSVHENVELIESKVESPKSKVGYLKSPILHYADPTFSRYLQRWDRYTTLDAKILFQNRGSKPVTSNLQPLTFINFFIIKPLFTFVSMYFRHKGFMDGFPGFVFALFSSIRFWVVYIKYWQQTNSTNSA